LLARTTRYFVAVAQSYGADVTTYEAHLCTGDVRDIEQLLTGLVALGHVAAFSISPAGSAFDKPALIQALRERWSFVVDSLIAESQSRSEATPVFLMPVWAFDHEQSGLPASSARFLHLDLEVIATPTADEERGVSLPGYTGAWVVHARPVLF